MKSQIVNQPNATWGKIKNYDLLSTKHKELLNQKLNPIWKPLTKREALYAGPSTDMFKSERSYFPIKPE